MKALYELVVVLLFVFVFVFINLCLSGQTLANRNLLAKLWKPGLRVAANASRAA